MQVKKEGKFGRPKMWKANVVCGKQDEFDQAGCGAELVVRPKDLFLAYWKGTHFRHYYTAVNCPRCGKLTRIKAVPEPILKKVRTEKNKQEAVFDGFSDE